MRDWGDLQILEMSQACDNWSQADLQGMFCKMVSLKIQGFQAEYPHGVLAVDTTDFFATHLLVVRRNERGELEPLTGVKIVTLARTDLHRMNFPPLSLALAANEPAHAEAIRLEIERCRSEKRNAGYIGSWTIPPEIRTNQPRLAVRLRTLMTTMVVRFCVEQGISPLFLGGTCRIGADRMSSYWGFRALQSKGKDLPPIRVTHLLGEPVLLMSTERFSDEVQADIEPFREAWESRLIIGPEHQQPRVMPAEDLPAAA